MLKSLTQDTDDQLLVREAAHANSKETRSDWAEPAAVIDLDNDVPER